jgi:DNA repair photolyase
VERNSARGASRRDTPDRGSVRGRGAAHNPTGRFEARRRDPDPEALVPGSDGALEIDAPDARTRFLPDLSRSAIATNQSPDVGFDASVNPYRGCEHGCAYCYARPTHEYLGYSAGLDFETKILVKRDAPALLRKELASPRWKPQVLALSGVTDAYQPAERRFGLTRGILEVLAECRNPVLIVTKNHLVTRDADLLARLADHRAAAVLVSLTTLDDDLCGVMEPRTSRPARRLAAIRALADAGIPVGTILGPMIPALTDHEMPRLLEAARDAGAGFAKWILLRLPGAVAPIFEDFLRRRFPDRAEHVLSRIRQARGGRLSDPRFGTRMRGEGVFADQTKTLFDVACRKLGLSTSGPTLSTAAFRRPGDRTLFD